MAYSTGILDKRVQIVTRTAAQVGTYGLDSSGICFTSLGSVWANVTWTKGVKAMREGALDAYDTIMIRMRYNSAIDRDCLVKYDGKWYEIQSCNRDRQANTIQLVCMERVNQDVTVLDPTPTPTSTPTEGEDNETTENEDQHE